MGLSIWPSGDAVWQIRGRRVFYATSNAHLKKRENTFMSNKILCGTTRTAPTQATIIIQWILLSAGWIGSSGPLCTMRFYHLPGVLLGVNLGGSELVWVYSK